MLQELKIEATRVGLQMHLSKIIIRSLENTQIVMDGQNVGNVEECIYLGPTLALQK